MWPKKEISVWYVFLQEGNRYNILHPFDRTLWSEFNFLKWAAHYRKLIAFLSFFNQQYFTVAFALTSSDSHLASSHLEVLMTVFR